MSVSSEAYDDAVAEIGLCREALGKIVKLATSGSPWLWASGKIAMVASEALKEGDLA